LKGPGGSGEAPNSRRCYELAVAALSFGGAENTTTLLRVCFISWSYQSSETQKFEEMQRDLVVCCEPAMSGGMTARLRTSYAAPGAAAAELKNEEFGEGLWPGLARLLGLPVSWIPPEVVAKEVTNDENAKPSNHSKNAVVSRSDSMGSTNSLVSTDNRLTSMAVARHNVQPLQQRTAPGLCRAASRSSSKEFGLKEFGLGLLGDVRPQPQWNEMAAVHVEREAGWRQHVHREPRSSPCKAAPIRPAAVKVA